MRAALARLADGEFTFGDRLDGPPMGQTLPIRLRIEKHGDRATIDFTGTGPVCAGNLNANRAIVTGAVMYCCGA